jgi:hypothetical protein
MLVRIALALVIAAAAASTAEACRCIPPPPPRKALEAAAAVFAGKVVKIKQDEAASEVVVTFEVRTVWKGVDTKTVQVRTPGNSAACGNEFEMDKSYLVYCHATQAEAKDGEKDPPRVLNTNLCTRTRALKDAEADLKELGKGRPPEGT